MAIRILPQVQQDPGRSQLGGVTQGVEPYRDFRGQQAQQAGAGVQRLGQGVGAAGEAIQDDIDVGFSANLVKDLGSEALRIRGEYDQKAGQDAIGDSHKRAKEEFRQVRSRIESRAQNNTQRDNFKRLADDIEMRTLSALDHHHANEAKAHRAGQMKALADLGRVDYLDSLGTERADLAKASALQAIEDRGRTLGLSDEEIAVDKLEWTSRTHETAVRMLVGASEAGTPGAVTAAAKYLSQNGAEMDPVSRRTVGAAIRNAGVKDVAARAAIALVDRPLPNAPADEGPSDGYLLREEERYLQRTVLAMEEARRAFTDGKIDADLLDAITSRIKGMQADRRSMLAERKEQVSSQAEKWLADNPNSGLRAMPAETYSQAEALGLLPQLGSFANSGRYVMDPKAFTEVSSLTRDELRQTPEPELLDRFRGRLNSDGVTFLRSRKAEADGRGTDRDRSVIEVKMRMERAARMVGILPADPTKDANAEQVLANEQFQFDFDRQLQSWQEKTGKKADDEDIQKLLDRHVIRTKEVMQEKVKVNTGGDIARAFGSGLGFSSGTIERKFSDVPKEEIGSVFHMVGNRRRFMREIPADVQAEIATVLNENGISPTTKAIMDWWVKIGEPQARN